MSRRKRKAIDDERDPTRAKQEDRYESHAMIDAADEHFTESFDYVDNARIQELEQALETAIVRIDSDKLQFQRVTLHRAYADFPIDITESEIEDLAFALVDLGENINFWLGDILLWLFKEKGAESSQDKNYWYEQFAIRFEKSHSVLKNAVWIAGNVPTSTRVDAPLSFTHYRTIVGATDSEDDVRMWALKAYKNGWSDRELKEALGKETSKEQLTTSDNYIWDDKRAVKEKKLERWWVDAHSGKKGARAKLNNRLQEIEEWIAEVRDSLSN